jgi:NADPH2:quinone reductase
LPASSKTRITASCLLQQQKIKPLIAQRFPLAEARQAQELLGKGGVTGKIVLVRDGSSLESGAA